MFLLPSPGTLIVQVLNFILFLVVLNFVFMRPVGAAIAKRRAYINGLFSSIDQAESDVRALRGQADAKRLAARREADEAIAKARAEASNEAGRVATEFNEQAAKIIDDSTKTVAGEVAAARAKEAAIVENLSATLLERALGPEALA
jgi:F-type H+-transporting ATPase subunit b